MKVYNLKETECQKELEEEERHRKEVGRILYKIAVKYNMLSENNVDRSKKTPESYSL